MNDTKKILTLGQDDIFFEVIDQLNSSDNEGIPTTFSKLRAWSCPNSKTSQVANVIPLASNYLKNWEGVGPLHYLKNPTYQALLETKGLSRCSLVETGIELKNPTEYAIKNKAYSWSKGSWVEYREFECLAEPYEGLNPVASIQQGNFVFCFFSGSSGKLFIWSVQSFEKALQSGKLKWSSDENLEFGGKVSQLNLVPTNVTSVVESIDSNFPQWSSYAEKPTQFTFGAPLEAEHQRMFLWKPSFLVCELSENPLQTKPVETNSIALCPQEILSIYEKGNVKYHLLGYSKHYAMDEPENELHLVEGSVYISGRETYCTHKEEETGKNEHKQNILVWLEDVDYLIRSWFNLCKDTEELFVEALNEAEQSDTFSILEVEYEIDID